MSMLFPSLKLPQ
ncbi:hypothetical protein A2U01_0097996, partial [Trifolium medium]|nr:hypothetical protein [Trifolium medium]